MSTLYLIVNCFLLQMVKLITRFFRKVLGKSYIYDIRKLCFLRKVSTSSNKVLLACDQYFHTSTKCKDLCHSFDIQGGPKKRTP